MISIKELKERLPKEALELLEKTLEPSTYNRVLNAFRIKRDTTFRINSLKTTKHNLIKELKKSEFKAKEISPFDGFFKIDSSSETKLLNSNLVKDGLIYIQSLSSMIVPLILDPSKNDKILDIAASPGSKTTQIASMMGNSGIIDAIEPDFIRMERLKYNSLIQGTTNINLYNTRGELFCKERTDYYDKILCDLPCSGEGRFSIYDKSSYSNWRQKEINRLSNLQIKLLKAAFKSLKPNGILVYSTCTMNLYENEIVLDKFIREEQSNVEIIKIDNKFTNFNETITPILKDYDNNELDKSISRAIRIIPSVNFEGFFITKIKKN
jgi:NOL1/NOP2/sun family putative RNA methylase